MRATYPDPGDATLMATPRLAVPAGSTVRLLSVDDGCGNSGA